MFFDIIEAQYVDNYKIKLLFEDGEAGIADLSDYPDENNVFRRRNSELGKTLLLQLLCSRVIYFKNRDGIGQIRIRKAKESIPATSTTY